MTSALFCEIALFVDPSRRADQNDLKRDSGGAQAGPMPPGESQGISKAILRTSKGPLGLPREACRAPKVAQGVKMSASGV